MFVDKYGWAIQESLFAQTNQDSKFSHIRENSTMFNITSKCFSFFNNKPPTKMSRVYSKGFSFVFPVRVIVPSLKHDLALEFFRNKNEDFSIWAETHINHNQIHCIRNNWLRPNFFHPRDSHTKGLLALFHPGLQGSTEVDTDPKRRFLSFKVTPSNGSSLCYEFSKLCPLSV